jgi:hypothetical protein
MKRALVILIVSAAAAIGGGQLPPPPSVGPAEALRRADEYVHGKFPQFPDIYCSEMTLEPVQDSCMPDPNILWRFRYLLPNNPVPAGPMGQHDLGVCLVYIRPDGSVYHTTEPRHHAKDD